MVGIHTEYIMDRYMTLCSTDQAAQRASKKYGLNVNALYGIQVCPCSDESFSVKGRLVNTVYKLSYLLGNIPLHL